MKIMLSRLPGIVLIALALAAAGCSKGPTAGTLAEARSYFERGDMNAASIQLKNIIRENPSSGAAHLLMARVLYSTGELSSARIEIQKAIDSAEPQSETLPLLARIMIAQGDFAEVIKRLSTTQIADRTSMVDLRTSLGFALFKIGKLSEAREMVATALASAPDYARAKLVEAGLELVSGDPKRAEAIVAGVLEREPENLEAWQLSGDIKRLDAKRLPEALSAYEHVIALKAADPTANAGIIDIYLTRGDIRAAEAQFAKMKALLPQSPPTLYYGARIAFLKGDLAAATDFSERLLGIQPDNVRGLVLAGMIATRTHSWARAEKHLTRAVQSDPHGVLPRRLLANVYLATGRPDRARSTLKPNLAAELRDTESMALAARAEMELGDMKAAESLYLQALSLTPEDPQLRSAAALMRISQGKAEQGYAELAAVAAADPGVVGDLALIGAATSRRDYARALGAVDRLQQKLANDPSVPALRGRILLEQGSQAAAKAQFERALAMDPKYFPAAEALALLSIGAGQPAEAQKRFTQLLQADPSNVPALLALAQIRAAAKAPTDEVVGILNRAGSASPLDPRPRVQLIQFLLQAGQAKRALAAAQEAAALLPEDLDVLDGLGAAQLASHELQQAKSTFAQLASLAPKSELPHLRLSDVYLNDGQEAEALKALNRALEIRPDSRLAQAKLISLHVRARRWDEAIAVARSMQKAEPDDAAGWVAEGEIEVKRQREDAAIAAFKTGVTKKQPYPAPARYFLALTSADKASQASAFADGWLAAHPQDSRFAKYAAEIEILRSDLEAAERHLLVASRINPRDGQTLNNLAWVLVRRGNSQGLAYAQRAVEVQPEKPDYLDTLAGALLAANDPKAAVEAAQKAQRLGPDNLTYTLTLAKAYWRSGQADQARSELAKLQKAGAKSAHRGEVDRLAAEWGK